jgi:hypothetical protein
MSSSAEASLTQAEERAHDELLSRLDRIADDDRHLAKREHDVRTRVEGHLTASARLAYDLVRTLEGGGGTAERLRASLVKRGGPSSLHDAATVEVTDVLKVVVPSVSKERRYRIANCVRYLLAQRVNDPTDALATHGVTGLSRRWLDRTRASVGARKPAPPTIHIPDGTAELIGGVGDGDVPSRLIRGCDGTLHLLPMALNAFALVEMDREQATAAGLQPLRSADPLSLIRISERVPRLVSTGVIRRVAAVSVDPNDTRFANLERDAVMPVQSITQP